MKNDRRFGPGALRSLGPAAVFATVSLFGTALSAQEAPEPDGAAVDPVETVGIHTVRRGDTLWGLAARFLRNPLRWPSIYETNTEVVEDPHWIYPGERLRIPGAVSYVADGVRVERADDLFRNLDDRSGRYPESSIFRSPRNSGSGLSFLSVDAGPPQPVITADDFHRAPLLVAPGALGPEGETVRVLEENPLELNLPSSARQYGQVIVALGGLDASVGDTLKAVRWERREEPYGVVVLPVAMLLVNHVWGDSARAEVVRLLADYRVGDEVVAPDAYQLDPAARPVESEADISGQVIAFAVPQTLLGPGEAVFLDLGSADGVQVGDEFAVFSRHEREALVSAEEDALVIVRVAHATESTSTAYVVRVRDPGTRPGDPIRRLRRIADYVPPETE
ncbi:MAG: LysM peptidoglycan-binding domain-containing protein [Gemmatimonadota bacterium]